MPLVADLSVEQLGEQRGLRPVRGAEQRRGPTEREEHTAWIGCSSNAKYTSDHRARGGGSSAGRVDRPTRSEIAAA